MNIYELILSMWVVILTLFFIYLFINIGRLLNKVDDLETYINYDLYPQFKNIRKLVKDEIIYKDRHKKPGVGKWIRIESDGTYGTCYWYACSSCHNRAPKSQYGTDYFSPYCPACGMPMCFESEVDT